MNNNVVYLQTMCTLHTVDIGIYGLQINTTLKVYSGIQPGNGIMISAIIKMASSSMRILIMNISLSYYGPGFIYGIP